ncbi:MAG TPA: biotin carboxylase N-terminal domain-containing protein [Trebonia sp.]|nr:biotin carboxylase N-terminal domain-containing protein [Trebonia sp.]
MTTPKTFTTVLVANRGEIAVRVLRSARAAGLRTVAVYSDADAGAPHVRAADLAVRVGPAPAAQSYLSIPALLEAARRSGADAVHPGYGFLSERAAFAQACQDAGLVFIGPPADVIETMGRKDLARRIAVGAGVPVVPAVEEDEEGARDDAALARRAAAEVGFPLLVKAASGGGGKGMRIVRDHASLPAALEAARREAASAFGDDTLLFERYVERGRHVEVQVLADAHGHVVHLFERDCSVQRRHQKVIEEAPPPTISAALRDGLTGAAVRLAKAVGYVNAGTVEFLVSGEDFYFLEMNTRLQVEHPVTEMVTGQDLVTLQLSVAAGRSLPFCQEELQVSGHAIEARVYAEDPASGFLPQAGRADVVRWPGRARVDSALEPGGEVGTWYDPMLAKIVVHGPTREAARGALVAALDDTAILGLTTNTGFLRRLAASDEFRDAAIDTAWLDRTPGSFPPPPPDLALLAAAWTLATRTSRQNENDPFGTADGWRVSGPAAPVLVELRHGAEDHLLAVDVAGGSVASGGRAWQVRPVDGGERLLLEVDGIVTSAVVQAGRHEVWVASAGQEFRLALPDAFGAGGGTALASDGTLSAPMPGTVLMVSAASGQVVATGEVLGVLEAMKMELPLAAPFDGVVSEVAVTVGDKVALGQRMFTVSATAQPSQEQE